MLRADCWICPQRHTQATNSEVAGSSWHRSMLSSPICDQAKVRHKETKERVRSTTDERMLRAPLTAHSCSLEAGRPLPAFALPPTLRRQLVVLLSTSRSNPVLKIQAREDELLQRCGRVLTHLSSLPPNFSKQQAALISLPPSTQMPGSGPPRFGTSASTPLHLPGQCLPQSVPPWIPHRLPPSFIQNDAAVDVNFLGARGHSSSLAAALVHRGCGHPGTAGPPWRSTSILPSSHSALQYGNNLCIERRVGTPSRRPPTSWQGPKRKARSLDALVQV